MNYPDNTVIKITIIADKKLALELRQELESIGLRYSYIITGRRDLLQERKGVFKLFGSGKTILHDSINIIIFFMAPGTERSVLNFIIKAGGLNRPGKGTVFSEEISLLGAHEHCRVNEIQAVKTINRELLTDLTGICCIAQRGEGDLLGKVGLETGGGVPSITLGTGTGLRDKIGLWRVTIPAEKEIVHLITTSHNAENVMDMMIEIGALDQPGKGFIYLYPITMGRVDVKAYVGLSRQAASIEQIVMVIDDIKGGTRWRRREFSKYPKFGKSRHFLTDLVNLTVLCNDGRATELAGKAMDAGAGGATISKVKYHRSEQAEPFDISPAREICEMIVSRDQVQTITDVLLKNGALDDNTHGLIYWSHVPRAFTYLGKS